MKEARELIASAAKSGHEYVGVQRAKAMVEIEIERQQLRSMMRPHPPNFRFVWRGNEVVVTEEDPEEIDTAPGEA